MIGASKEMQWVKVPAALADDLSSVPSPWSKPDWCKELASSGPL